MLENGAPFSLIVEQISRRRHTMCQYFTVDDLAYLERGGRVSKAAAIVGTVLKIKPLLRGDDEGKIVQCGKTRGRKQSLTALADFYEKLVADKSEEIGIAHADDAAGAQFLLDALRQRGFTGECLTVCYEPVTGSHVGPGGHVLRVFYVSFRSTCRIIFSNFARGPMTSRPQPRQRSLKSAPMRSTSQRFSPQGCCFFIVRMSPT